MKSKRGSSKKNNEVEAETLVEDVNEDENCIEKEIELKKIEAERKRLETFVTYRKNEVEYLEKDYEIYTLLFKEFNDNLQTQLHSKHLREEWDTYSQALPVLDERNINTFLDSYPRGRILQSLHTAVEACKSLQELINKINFVKADSIQFPQLCPFVPILRDLVRK